MTYKLSVGHECFFYSSATENDDNLAREIMKTAPKDQNEDLRTAFCWAIVVGLYGRESASKNYHELIEKLPSIITMEQFRQAVKNVQAESHKYCDISFEKLPDKGHPVLGGVSPPPTTRPFGQGD